MGKIAIKGLIQLFGMVGIIGSLIFVGLEMQQSQRIAFASQQQERAAITVDMINASMRLTLISNLPTLTRILITSSQPKKLRVEIWSIKAGFRMKMTFISTSKV